MFNHLHDLACHWCIKNVSTPGSTDKIDNEKASKKFFHRAVSFWSNLQQTWPPFCRLRNTQSHQHLFHQRETEEECEVDARDLAVFAVPVEVVQEISEILPEKNQTRPRVGV